MKIRKLSIALISLFFLSGCISHFAMNPDKLAKMKEEEHNVVVFKVNLNYGGDKIDLYPPSTCQVFFTNQESKILKAKFSKEANGGNYAFVLPNSETDEIYLHNIQCIQYRVFYNKIRIKTFDKKIASLNIQQSKKISYAGDIDIHWNSQGFRFYDIFLLGHFGLDDKGSSSAIGKDRYKNYLDFMSEKYHTNEDGSKNLADKNILKNLSQDE